MRGSWWLWLLRTTLYGLRPALRSNQITCHSVQQNGRTHNIYGDVPQTSHISRQQSFTVQVRKKNRSAPFFFFFEEQESNERGSVLGLPPNRDPLPKKEGRTATPPRGRGGRPHPHKGRRESSTSQRKWDEGLHCPQEGGGKKQHHKKEEAKQHHQKEQGRNSTTEKEDRRKAAPPTREEEKTASPKRRRGEPTSLPQMRRHSQTRLGTNV